jgi:hypothetical protein
MTRLQFDGTQIRTDDVSDVNLDSAIKLTYSSTNVLR